MLLLHANTNIPKMKWMLVLFKLDRVIFVKGNVDYDDVEKILDVVDFPKRIVKTANQAQDSAYEGQILEVVNREDVKAFLEQFRPMKQ